jgi:hypothetical protein
MHKVQEEKSRLTAMAWLRSHFPAGLLGSKEEVQKTFGTRMGTEVDMQVYASDGTPMWPRRRPIPFTVSSPEPGDSLMDEMIRNVENMEPRGHKRKASTPGGL